MKVDNSVLESMTADLTKRIQANDSERILLRELYRDAFTIKLIDVPDPKNPDNPKKSLPIDRTLDTKITTKRREQIYDCLVSKVQSLRK